MARWDRAAHEPICAVPVPDSDPGFAGVTGFRTFYEVITLGALDLRHPLHLQP